ncbi:MAG: methyltransferase [Clostridiales bacterium]|nr:methyltransferase [Clostridiales bacterium]
MAVIIKNKLETDGVYDTLMINSIRGDAPPRYKTPISPRENFFRFLKNDKPVWLPNTADFITFIPKIFADNIARAFVFDNEAFDPDNNGGGPDAFNVEWEYIPAVGGSMVRPGNPVKIPDISRWEDYIAFPDLNKLDWAHYRALNKGIVEDDRVKVVWVMNGIFERLISFMTFENAALALIDEDQQEHVHRLFDRLCDFYDELVDKFHVYYGADGIYFHDDWGSQRAPFFSVDTAREMIAPYLRRFCDSCHKRGMYVELHSCGKIETLVPVMIEAGVDIWSGQEMNDKVMLVKKYCDRIKIGVFPRLPMDNATDDDVVKAVEQLMEEYKGCLHGLAVFPMQFNSDLLYRVIYDRTYMVM